ncbi:MAG: hypothetical protein JMN25_18110 [gamma proteobacterium endosymbiont of Lamellibrachia anaximandri]|nr:hypothetical protein [gamma proteobacterium endosymbiont of Lamellibrachia anaximandri]
MNSYRNRLRRLRLLQFISQAYPELVSDQMLLTLAKTDPELRPTIERVRRSMQYLSDRGFIAIETKTDAVWMARCLPDGIDYLEGDDPEINGMAHPSDFMKEVSK